jgi:hypothetical protein
MTVTAAGNAVETTALARSFEVLVLQPNLQPVTAGLEPQ